MEALSMLASEGTVLVSGPDLVRTGDDDLAQLVQGLIALTAR